MQHFQDLYLARRIEEYLDKVEENRKKRQPIKPSQSDPSQSTTEVHTAQVHHTINTPTHPSQTVSETPEESQEQSSDSTVESEEEQEGEQTFIKGTYPTEGIKTPDTVEPVGPGEPSVVPKVPTGSGPQDIPVPKKSPEELKAEIERDILIERYLEEVSVAAPDLEDKGFRLFDRYTGYITTGLSQAEYIQLVADWTEYCALFQVYEGHYTHLKRLVKSSRDLPPKVLQRQEPDWHTLESFIRTEQPNPPEPQPNPPEPETPTMTTAMEQAKLRKQLTTVMNHVTKFSGSSTEDPLGHLQSFQLHFRLVTGVDVLAERPMEGHDDSPVTVHDVLDYFQCTLFRYAKQWYMNKYGKLTTDQRTWDQWAIIHKDFIKTFNLFGKTDTEKEQKLRDIKWDPTEQSWEDFLLSFRSLMCGADAASVPESRQLTCFILAMPKSLLSVIMNQTTVEGAIEAVTNAVSLGYIETKPTTVQKTEVKAPQDVQAAAAVPFMSAASVHPSSLHPGGRGGRGGNRNGMKKQMQDQMQDFEQRLMQRMEEVMYVGSSGNSQGGQGQRPWRGGGQGGQGYRGRGRGNSYQGNQQQGGGYWNDNRSGWGRGRNNWSDNRNRDNWRNDWRGPPRGGRGRGGYRGDVPDGGGGGSGLGNVQCYNCKQYGHLSRNCPKPPYQKPQGQQQTQQQSQAQRGAGQSQGSRPRPDQNRGASGFKIDRKDLADALSDIMKTKKDESSN